MIRRAPEVEENFEEMYHVVDYTGKVVLDVGGDVGDTAVLFGKWGARKVIVYEPLEKNVKYIKRNVELNGIDAEIHPLAVCDKCGEVDFMVDRKSINTMTFGLKRGGCRVRLRGVSWKRVLKDAIKKNVEIAKVDCEGCERFLLNLDKNLIKKIPYWIVEIHNQVLEKALVKLFTRISYEHKVIIPRSSLSFSIILFSNP